MAPPDASLLIRSQTFRAARAATGDTDGAGRGFKRKPSKTPDGPGDGALSVPYARRSRGSAILIGESRMGILSWLRSLRSADVPEDEPNSLIKYRYEDPAFEPVEKAAAADVAAVEEDAKFFGPDSPASQDEL